MEINKLTFYNIRYNIKIEGVYNRGRKVYEISNGSRNFFKLFLKYYCWLFKFTFKEYLQFVRRTEKDNI